MKKCPYCAEKIQDEAIVCRYCGRDLPKESIEQKSKQNKTSVWRHGAIVSGVLSVLYIIAELANSPLLKLNEQPAPLVFRAMLQDLLFRLIIGLVFNFIVIGLLAAGSFALWRKFGVVPFLIISVIGIIGYAVITDTNQNAKSQLPPPSINTLPISTSTSAPTLEPTATLTLQEKLPDCKSVLTLTKDDISTSKNFHFTCIFGYVEEFGGDPGYFDEESGTFIVGLPYLTLETMKPAKPFRVLLTDKYKNNGTKLVRGDCIYTNAEILYSGFYYYIYADTLTYCP